MKKVAFIELTVFPSVYPLASGYMETIAKQNSDIVENYEFKAHSICINEPTYEQEINSISADIFAISCYVWNTGFIKRWLPTLLQKLPNINVILGGPQVMNKAQEYLYPSDERVVVCNGEGEYTFTEYLLQLQQDKPDLKSVAGISFYKEGELVTTNNRERIKDLNSIPSPYLNGYMDTSKYIWAMLETNRGCPFKCTYCYWGAATNAKVHKSDLERVKLEISWPSENRALYVFITDANFGMLERDIEIAEHLAKCRQKNGYPQTVFFSSSKNTPERVRKITKILSSANLVSTQPVSLQTLDPTALNEVKRGNIKESSYIQLQEDLKQDNLSSFIEMIWPLPGETLSSFRNGIGKLCSSDADAFVIHHLLLINNVELDSQREQHQLRLTDDKDPNSEAKIVIGTKDVNADDYKDGVRFGYHVTSLYSLRSLRFVGSHLDSTGIMKFSQLFEIFTHFCKQNHYSYRDYIEDVISSNSQTKFSATGGIFHITLHEHRKEFDKVLFDFMTENDLTNTPYIRFLFELDLLNRPYVYSNTPIEINEKYFEYAKILCKEESGYTVEIPNEYSSSAAKILGISVPTNRIRVNYKSTQMPFMKARSLDKNYSYCEAKLHKMGSILPSWTPSPS